MRSRPEKTIAFITNKGCCYNNTLPPTASLNTPGILIAGELDTDVRRNNIRALFDNNRSRGALWSWVEQPGIGHAGLAQELTVPFMDEAIRHATRLTGADGDYWRDVARRECHEWLAGRSNDMEKRSYENRCLRCVSWK